MTTREKQILARVTGNSKRKLGDWGKFRDKKAIIILLANNLPTANTADCVVNV